MCLFFLSNRFARLKVVFVENYLGHGIRRAVIPAGITGVSVKADPDPTLVIIIVTYVAG